MIHTLWLQYERPPHADAVVYPANEADLRLVLALLELPWRDRKHLAEQLRNWLSASTGFTPLNHPRVAVRFGQGLYQPVPWRLAKWLACVLPIGEGGAMSTSSRIRHWLENNQAGEIVSPNG